MLFINWKGSKNGGELFWWPNLSDTVTQADAQQHLESQQFVSGLFQNLSNSTLDLSGIISFGSKTSKWGKQCKTTQGLTCVESKREKGRCMLKMVWDPYPQWLALVLLLCSASARWKTRFYIKIFFSPSFIISPCCPKEESNSLHQAGKELQAPSTWK